MVQGVDFLRLYREFQLEPGAGIDDLKLAYRRRVARVHPDRLSAKDPISQHLATEHLQNLTRLYEAGLQFHRQHGRLPGALPSAASEQSAARTPPVFAAAPPRRRRRRLGPAIVVAGFGLTALLAFWPFDEDTTDVESVVAARREPATPAFEVPGQSEGLRLGMPEQVVIEVIGAPMAREGDRWLYGPSWIRFEGGHVAEWYSSPLHTLRISPHREPWPGTAVPALQSATAADRLD
ncbi:J domain-containing protein [Dokdonella immobilis]|uniref:J domain-containing protein n=1 Tax=Dokdonella immobilis TaxID=578942 RepID=A0A1I4ZZ51_9GAMM|nr:J domain-containing protein [Dokdonella immobilis]SFN55349.1 hypothetical protein SAMN05216289_13029 [Dokdonella immobilis]